MEAAIRLQFVTRERVRPLADSIDRLQKLLYGMQRERFQRLGISVATGVTTALMVFRHFS